MYLINDILVNYVLPYVLSSHVGTYISFKKMVIALANRDIYPEMKKIKRQNDENINIYAYTRMYERELIAEMEKHLCDIEYQFDIHKYKSLEACIAKYRANGVWCDNKRCFFNAKTPVENISRTIFSNKPISMCYGCKNKYCHNFPILPEYIEQPKRKMMLY